MSRESAASGEPPASAHSPHASRSFLALLLLGIAIRCVALTQPLVDAHLLRQCQTAAVTRSLLEQPGFPLAAQIPWLGDIEARFILEVPLYNYLVIAVHAVVGDLDVSGKVTTILLWALSFALLQGIWRRLLDREQTMWASLLFVLAPLEVFYGQAFMPEMLVQALAFGFLLLALRYAEVPTASRWIACAVIGLVGLLVKLPEVAHLYVILGFLIVRAHGWRATLWPRHLVAAVLSFVALKFWGDYTDAINRVHLPEWTSEHVLPGFVGSLASRFTVKPWAAVAAYLGFFVIPGIAAVAAGVGLWIAARARCRTLLIAWVLSIAAYYFVWFGNAGTAQSYYNLPAVAPLCALFSLGVCALLRWGKFARWQTAARIAVVALLLASVTPGLRYLFQKDTRILAAARWVRDHSQPGDLILVRPAHRWDMSDYFYNPVIAHLADRPTFVWTPKTPEPIQRTALARAPFAVVIKPAPPATGLAGKIARLRGTKPPQAEPDAWLLAAGFTRAEEQEAFAAYRRE
jgi:hypothetical protein